MTLAIIQARIHSNRLERKMLLPINGKPIIYWAWIYTKWVYPNTVIACPASDVEAFHQAVLNAEIYGYAGDEDDVLGRFHACAHTKSPDPSLVIARITPDDWPIDPFRERCALWQLDKWHETVRDPKLRQHIGELFYLLAPRIEINLQSDYEAACQIGPMVK